MFLRKLTLDLGPIVYASVRIAALAGELRDLFLEFRQKHSGKAEEDT